MTVDVIKDFLVSLGFEVDDAGKNKFDAVLKGVTANVLRLGAKVEGAALAVVGFTTQAASGLDRLYWASQRTGATANGIKALGYAAAQTGVSADLAISSLESLSRFMRNNPGAEGFLNRLGVQTRDAKGQMLDTAAIFTGVGQRLSQMPYYRANQYAQMLGIDENTLMAMRRGLNGFTADYQSMMQKTGFNAEKAAEQSNKFMTSMTELTSLMGILRDKIGSNLAGGLSSSIDDLKKRILDNFPKIEATLTKIIRTIFWLANAFSRMAYRVIQAGVQVIDWWGKLSDSSKRLIGVLVGLLVAWKVLNSAFIKSPIGLITALIVALGLLYDDYMTWKEGGDSLIDWTKWEQGVNYALGALEEISGAISELWRSVKELGKSLGRALEPLSSLIDEFGKLIGLDFSRFSGKALFDGIIKSIKDNITVLRLFVDALRQVIDGDFSGAFSTLKQAGSLIFDNTFAGRTYTQLNNKLNEYLPEWLGGTPSTVSDSEPVQYAQSARRRKSSPLLEQMSGVFSRLEKLYNLPMGVLHGVAMTESSGNPNAISKAGAKGLFQFMDATAREMGLFGNDVFDPMKAAEAAAKYLSRLLKANGGNLDKALASYNWGIGNVQKYGMALLPQETRNYIPRVKGNMVASNQIQQKNTYHIYGGNPAEIGREVERRQLGANAQFMRSTQGRNS
ncbi:lytic transglycosylase domain-containing protein [Hafnia alvei]|uniref:lytic transglycosylase domain-containing protein n=1 Tax=Hafnia alvei TaxID=569 RepID=UPI001412FD5D|nr:lytic transglycosylase domain-containing protein [Hafnia alvei]QIP56827.1 transglycosylase SLT domain-containing protein [Hafnia alvei]